MEIIGTDSGGVRMVVYDSRIDAMALPGGDVFRYAQRKTNQTVIRAKDNVKSRTGRLERSIRGDVRPLARGKVIGRVRAETYYALWVHEGTTGPIVAYNFGDKLWVPARKGGVRRVWMEQVNGQKANPFLEDALRSSIQSPFGRRMFGDSNPFGGP